MNQEPETKQDMQMRTTEDKIVRLEARLALLLNICAKLTKFLYIKLLQLSMPHLAVLNQKRQNDMLCSPQAFKSSHHLSLRLQASQWIAKFWHHLKIYLKVFPECSVCTGSLQVKMGKKRRESLGPQWCRLNHLL